MSKIMPETDREENKQVDSTLIHISITAPPDLLTFGRYNFAAKESSLEATLREGNAQKSHHYISHNPYKTYHHLSLYFLFW